MPYDATISFTFDTICPFTYLAKKRIDRALTLLVETPDDNPSGTTFTYQFNPFILNEDAPEVGEDKYQWYLKNKQHGDQEKMDKYMALMSAYGVGSGINFKHTGTIASTLDAHRVIQHFQETKGADVANKLVMSLYRKYFEEEQHPSSEETLLAACLEAGVSAAEAREVVEDHSEGMAEVKGLIREQKGNGIDAVPNVTFEGKKRDVTLEGAKEVDEFLKALKQICKEAA
ncbi:hypothetical protein FH972_025672 [Carpinus fangiana]|uniref:DSBA-like thioredoxin domain-containing protein n=1 Tax=Carpinus fangiana TaxID=176857 RepID=A0A5N6L240_9ROSI|nr:hypothetical protein FH972_025672 [Carpinus fangiana]